MARAGGYVGPVGRDYIGINSKYPYVFVDGIYLKRSWGGSFENVAVMLAIGVNADGYR